MDYTGLRLAKLKVLRVDSHDAQALKVLQELWKIIGVNMPITAVKRSSVGFFHLEGAAPGQGGKDGHGESSRSLRFMDVPRT